MQSDNTRLLFDAICLRPIPQGNKTNWMQNCIVAWANESLVAAAAVATTTTRGTVNAISLSTKLFNLMIIIHAVHFACVFNFRWSGDSFKPNNADSIKYL